MSVALSHRLVLALAAASVALPLATEAASAQSGERYPGSPGGVAITIRKTPSYLNTRTVARPNASDADYRTSAVYQSSTPTRGGGFSRYPLPSGFDVPGY
jgi:hypothetical protein